jgi:hypothetical protein
VINPVAAQAIVEQVWEGQLLRWVFVLKDEEGTKRYEGLRRVTKLDAMADRDKMIRDSADVDDYEPTDEWYWVLRVARRAIYLTRG